MWRRYCTVVLVCLALCPLPNPAEAALCSGDFWGGRVSSIDRKNAEVVTIIAQTNVVHVALNALSVWLVEPDRSNLERVVRAVAIGKPRVDSAGWVIFDSDLLGPLGIGIVEAPGGTKDEAANAWHRDLIHLSGNKLIALAKAILESGESGTIPKKRMAQLIEDGIRNNELPDSLRGRLEL